MFLRVSNVGRLGGLAALNAGLQAQMKAVRSDGRST